MSLDPASVFLPKIDIISIIFSIFPYFGKNIDIG